jgi:glc operon protein GlcG
VSSMPTISAKDVRRVLDAAVAHAETLNVRIAVAMVDSGGNLQALERMDNATFLATTLATHKAITAAGLGVSTTDFAKIAADNPVLLATMSTQPNSALLPGGVPVIVDGVVAGAIGVAGGTRGEDDPIARAGLAAIEG